MQPLPTAAILEQSDGTSWMAMYTLNMLAIAMELADEDPAYEDIASKFWEHFLYIANAMNSTAATRSACGTRHDGFFYDVLHTPTATAMPLKVRSMVGPHSAVRGRDARAASCSSGCWVSAGGWNGSSRTGRT